MQAVVDTGSPINRTYHPNDEILAWWLNLPGGQWGRGSTFHDLTRRYDMALENSPTRDGARGRTGGMGSINFNGSTQRGNAGTGFANFALSDPFTVCGWLYATTVDSAHHGIIGRHSAGGVGWRIRLSSNNKLRFGISDGTNYRLTDTAAIVANQWYHVAGTWDGATDAVTYLNGELSSTDLSFGTPVTITGANTLYLGYDQETATYFAGNLDDWRIFPRMLRAEEIKDLVRESRDS